MTDPTPKPETVRPVDVALSLVTCASDCDATSARAILSGLDLAEMSAVTLHLAGMCWTSFERNGAVSGIDARALFRMFAAGCQDGAR